MPRSSASLPIVPVSVQPRLPETRHLRADPPDAEAVPMDVLFVGGGPAGLAGAIELARLVARDREEGGRLGELEIGVLEKAAEIGGHSLSGAIVNPGPFRTLFPELSDDDFPFRGEVPGEAVHFLTGQTSFRIPTPPSMRNHGNRIASICEIVRWMGEQAEALGVHLLPGFPVDALLMDGSRVVGVRTAPSGRARDGTPGPGFAPPVDLTARVTVLAEGARGPLAEAWLRREGIRRRNPQTHALGVKELWRVPRAPDRVLHTLGWPLPPDTFGGSWLYPMGPDLLSMGLVVGLDAPDAGLDVHDLLQRFKLHPFVRPLLEGGEMLEWGAKTIPEGGYHAIPERRHGDGLLLVGDAAGFVDVASLKGIHYAVQSGILAARAIFRALQTDDASAAALGGYTEAVDRSFVMEELRRTRNVRAAFRRGRIRGSLAAGAMILTGGRLPARELAMPDDASVPRLPPSGTPPLVPDGTLTFSKEDAVFRSGNRTRDDIPPHLVTGANLPPEVIDFYVRLCPAGVYERDGDRLIVHAPNCIDCRATDVVGPRWTVREGGSGPAYRRM